jgi:simple sugar transport system permease protein
MRSASTMLGNLIPRTTEAWLVIVIIAMAAALGVMTTTFLTAANLLDLVNLNAVNVIFAVGLLAVLVTGGIDISFAVAASVVQYLTALAVARLGGGNWAWGLLLASLFGFTLGAINAGLIYYFRIISIIVTIATFSIFFGMLMFFTHGVSIYDLPDWWVKDIVLFKHQIRSGDELALTLPVAVMILMVLLTWILLKRLNLGRQLYALGDNPEGARRIGVDVRALHFLAYGWLGVCAGIGGLMQVHYVKEVVPNALFGRELDVLAATVLGGARLGGGRGTILGVLLGVALIAITGNGLNLLAISPYAFDMIIGAVILIAITVSNLKFTRRAVRRSVP